MSIDTTNNDNTIAKAGVTSVLQASTKMQDLDSNKQKLIDYISQSLIGSHWNTHLRTVFGQKPFVYLDHTASSKNVSFIEDYLRETIMPIYANSHSMQSASGK